MKIWVLNGPNLNLLGVREPSVYGNESYDDLVRLITEYAGKRDIEVRCLQTNQEGVLVDWIQEAYRQG
ncbi:MAG: type II 3-dehydroquinate dehydratase, partial [Lachnospiraceae bacterium]|nr:type II 3-dehydroquinate dehydratase [Lachnospiraceae bacterium]